MVLCHQLLDDGVRVTRPGRPQLRLLLGMRAAVSRFTSSFIVFLSNCLLLRIKLISTRREERDQKLAEPKFLTLLKTHSLFPPKHDSRVILPGTGN